MTPTFQLGGGWKEIFLHNGTSKTAWHYIATDMALYGSQQNMEICIEK